MVSVIGKVAALTDDVAQGNNVFLHARECFHRYLHRQIPTSDLKSTKQGLKWHGSSQGSRSTEIKRTMMPSDNIKISSKFCSASVLSILLMSSGIRRDSTHQHTVNQRVSLKERGGKRRLRGFTWIGQGMNDVCTELPYGEEIFSATNERCGDHVNVMLNAPSIETTRSKAASTSGKWPP